MASVIPRFLYDLKRPIFSFGALLFVLTETITVQWVPNSETDLAGYKLYYGTASRQYHTAVRVGTATSCTVKNLLPGYDYFFAISAYDIAGNESALSDEVTLTIPGDRSTSDFQVEHACYNYPNPFNPEAEATHVRYFLSHTTVVSLRILDVAGNPVKIILDRQTKSAGEHTEDSWDGRNENGQIMPNGIYYAQLNYDNCNEFITVAITR
ncbi:MAG: fibronectin type III domain-containing protein [candidate division KSB1 bacterium]|nr:fibronectin type III domain-containing protein [candidate division KSB1 bacterium]